MTAPTAALAGRVTNLTATTVTVQLDRFPSTNIDGWRVAYRTKVRAGNAPNDWSYSATSSTVQSGATIQLTGLTEGSTYELALQGLNGTETGDFGQIFTIVTTGGKNTFDGTQITEQIMSLIDNNLTASNRLGLTRNANFGTLRDYPNLRDQTDILPMVLVQPLGISYEIVQFPKVYEIQYRYRILYVRTYQTTQDVVKLRNDSLGELVGLFADYPQLGFDGGRLSQGLLAFAIVESGEVMPPEDEFHEHDHIFVVALTLRAQVRARA